MKTIIIDTFTYLENGQLKILETYSYENTAKLN